MERIWAPWRMKFILEGTKDRCLFCDVRDSGEDRKNFVIERGERALVMFNIYPYNNGHLMVAPTRHESEFDGLDDQELREANLLVQKWVRILKGVLRPDGFNIGLNLGRVAGAGFEGHLHYHIVPRWNGDTNFMPVIAGTKVLSESLEAAYDRLKEALAASEGR
ncbi:MAG: HIT domain-containing protein [Candidatus Eremiobacteraeota bacterium]|nr:HIT domain-containing protein [Candidatus Eremiobacteraeota bacterium]